MKYLTFIFGSWEIDKFVLLTSKLWFEVTRKQETGTEDTSNFKTFFLIKKGGKHEGI